MDTTFGWIAFIIMAGAFLALPVYLLYLTLSSKKVDQPVKKETISINTTDKR